MRKRTWLFRSLLVALLLFAQHGALAHALKHSTEAGTVTAHAELCSQCLDFAQVDAAPLAIDVPQLRSHSGEGALQVSRSPESAPSDFRSFNFQSRAPPLPFA